MTDIEYDAREAGFEEYLKIYGMDEDYEWEGGDAPSFDGAYDDGWNDAKKFFAVHPELLSKEDGA